jgi:hypothetical protein
MYQGQHHLDTTQPHLGSLHLQYSSTVRDVLIMLYITTNILGCSSQYNVYLGSLHLQYSSTVRDIHHNKYTGML